MILRLIIGVIVIYLLFRLFRKGFPRMGESRSGGDQTAVAGEELVEDPLCHTYVPIGDACRTQIDGKTVYFCSPKCLEQYKSEKNDSISSICLEEANGDREAIPDDDRFTEAVV